LHISVFGNHSDLEQRHSSLVLASLV